MDQSYISLSIDRLQASVLNGYKLGVLNGNREIFQSDEKINEFTSILERCCDIEEGLKVELALVGRFQCQSVENFDKEFSQSLANLKKNQPKAKDSLRYQKFMKDIEDIQLATEDTQAGLGTTNALAEALQAIDDELQVEEVTTRIDPISKKPIQKPYTNTICKHIYDYDSISEAIRLNPKIKCPYMGCSNKRAVALHDLVENRALKRKFIQEETQMDVDTD